MTDGAFPLTVVLLVILLVASTGRVGAINLAQCGMKLAERNATYWNVTLVPTAPPSFNLSYTQCLAECGDGMGDIDWARFSQTFSSWLLPWIALMFQIPFGGEGELCTLSGS
jgi:hypothetical protein